MAAPLVAALLAGVSVVSAAVSSSTAGRHHHHVSVVDAGAAVRVTPSRKEY